MEHPSLDQEVESISEVQDSVEDLETTQLKCDGFEMPKLRH